MLEVETDVLNEMLDIRLPKLSYRKMCAFLATYFARVSVLAEPFLKKDLLGDVSDTLWAAVDGTPVRASSRDAIRRLLDNLEDEDADDFWPATLQAAEWALSAAENSDCESAATSVIDAAFSVFFDPDPNVREADVKEELVCIAELVEFVENLDDGMGWKSQLTHFGRAGWHDRFRGIYKAGLPDSMRH